MSFKTSIIIVSYNNYDETTGDCLKSLLANESNKNIEIIVVDNHSQDKTADMLKTIASENENVKIILNKTNRGFAGGNNDGVREANGEIVVLLNSDTIVPPGAISRLADRLASNKNWAMLGPITNEAGTEQKIYTKESDCKKIIEDGESWCRHSNDDCFESQRLDFCCVAIKKEIYNTLGGLDEDFGAGYYEDTDFSLKALSTGCKMFFTENVFIYHKAGKSFSANGRKHVKKLMKSNKRLLKKKHPHNFKLHHIRDCNLNILKEYVELQHTHKDNAAYCKNLQYRFQRRMMLAETLYPNNPLKKMIYHSRLLAVKKKFIQE